MIPKNSRFLVPNLFTGLNITIGIAAVYFAITGNFLTSAWLIILSTVMDKLDGTTARLFNASTEFGVQFDSFSDFFSFGVAPASFYFFYVYNKVGGNVDAMPVYIKFAVVLYILFAAVRLAKFNCQGKDDHTFFHGITSTQSGGMLAAFYAMADKYQWDIINDFNFLSGMIIAHAVLMVSYFRYPKLKKLKNKYLNHLLVFAMAFFVFLILTRKLPELLYFAGFVYIILGYSYVKLIYKPEPSTAAKEDDDELGC